MHQFTYRSLKIAYVAYLHYSRMRDEINTLYWESKVNEVLTILIK